MYFPRSKTKIRNVPLQIRDQLGDGNYPYPLGDGNYHGSIPCNAEGRFEDKLPLP